jgi:hypothetical protein
MWVNCCSQPIGNVKIKFNFIVFKAVKMKKLHWLYAFTLSLVLLSFYGCDKEEYFKSESGTQKELTGSWNLIPIPKYNPDGSLHTENWTFAENGNVNIEKNGNHFSATYSISTTLTTVKIKLENTTSEAEFYNGSWQVVKLNSKFLVIANDHDGATGLAQLEFQKGN